MARGPDIKKVFRYVQAHGWWVNSLFAVLFIAVTTFAWLGYKQVEELSLQITTLSKDIALVGENVASTTSFLQGNIEETRTSLSGELQREKENINQQIGSFEQEVGNISGTVTTLEKLSKTDPELLQKYSKVFFLNEHYAPERLVELPDTYEYYEYKHTKVHEKVWPYLRGLLNEAGQDGIDLYVFSGYRSFSEQEALKGQYAVVYGEGTANQFSADQGYSEHQLGTTVDFITTGIGGTLSGFSDTEAYNWLLNNAHKYGFVLSYPDDNPYYVFEPWHWRFVGVKLATDLHNSNQGFYDLDQRDIDEYLIYLFD